MKIINICNRHNYWNSLRNMEKSGKTKLELRSSKRIAVARTVVCNSKNSKTTLSADDVKTNIKSSDLSVKVLVPEKREKRKPKPNLRYVDNANGPLDRKQVIPIRRAVTASSSESTTVKETDGTETVCNHQKTSDPSRTEKSIKKRRKSKKVRYEVDCTDIKDLDMLEFQTYLRSEVKVAGSKNSPYLKVSKQGLRIVIKSKIFVAKKALRFSVRKYLKNKKKRSVSVVNESKNSYKLTVKM